MGDRGGSYTKKGGCMTIWKKAPQGRRKRGTSEGLPRREKKRGQKKENNFILRSQPVIGGTRDRIREGSGTKKAVFLYSGKLVARLGRPEKGIPGLLGGKKNRGTAGTFRRQPKLTRIQKGGGRTRGENFVLGAS